MGCGQGSDGAGAPSAARNDGKILADTASFQTAPHNVWHCVTRYLSCRADSIAAAVDGERWKAMRMRHGIGFLAVLLAMGSSNAAPQKEKIPSKDLAEFLTWAQPVKPYRIIGNVYYVGANELTSYLITTPQGHILIDAGMEEMVPQIEKNIETLGFRVRDVKILLNT